MKTLLKGGNVVNVFTKEIEKLDVLIKDSIIVGVGNYSDTDADNVCDVTGKFICPGFIDSHIHIESTMMTPSELANVSVVHGTTAVVADPHEIANVCGTKGIEYMLEASKDIPLTVYIMLPSCVPATSFDESGATLLSKDLEPFYNNERVLGLAEVMNYPGVINNDADVLEKINSAKEKGKVINGHAPLLTGKDLDKYISAGICDDHECSSFEEAKERIRKGQHIMIRQGTQAKNLEGLIDLFDEPWAQHCMLVTDDIRSFDLTSKGHIDEIIRQAVKLGKSAITGICMATIWPAKHFGLKNIGAVAPGYIANILVLDNLNDVEIVDVYKNGKKVVENKKLEEYKKPEVKKEIIDSVMSSFNVKKLNKDDFYINADAIKKCNVINLIENQLITDKLVTELDFSSNNGIDVSRDILKIAVIERHKNTGHIGIGCIKGIGIKCGAIASSVSHDSHNLVVIGTNEVDMAYAANKICEMGGGEIVVKNEQVLASIPLPIAGLMSIKSADEVSSDISSIKKGIMALSDNKPIDPFMIMAFSSLTVIPHIKLATTGLVDVDRQQIVPLFCD